MPNKSAQRKRLRSAHGSWKDAQSKRQNIKKTKLALIVFGIIVILLLISQAFKFTTMLYTPWKETVVKKEVLWDGDFNINLIIKSKTTSLLTFNPKERKIVIIDLPGNTYLDVTGGFGKWQLSSVYDLGASQKEIGGSKLLGDSLENLFGLPIDGVLYFFDKYSQKETSEIVSEIKKNPFAIVSVLPYLKSNLTPFELIKLNMGISGVRFDKVKQVNLEEELDLLQKEKLLDGTDIYTPDLIKLDSILTGIVDTTIQSERKTIAIFNSTSHPGMAQKAARLITNIGGEVIITSNGQKTFEKTVVVGEESKTLDRLKQIFGSGDIIDPEDKDLVSSRAQINIFLGEDYFE